MHSRMRDVVALLVLVFLFGACSEKSVDQLLDDARQQRAEGNFRSAVINLKSALQKSPDNPEARYLLGVTYDDVGDFNAAEVELRRAIDLGHERAKVAIGKPLLMRGEFQKVLDQVALNSGMEGAAQAEILTLRARALLGLGRTHEGRELLDQALAKQPEFADALLALAILAAREKNVDEVSQLIERAIASTPKNVEAWMMKGDLARIRADQASALTAYQKVLEVSPENIPARLNVAALQIDAQDFDGARKQLDQVRKLAHDNLGAKYLTALLEFNKKNYPAARESVLGVLKAAPNYLPGVLLAGATEVALGSHEQAQRHLGSVLEQAPRHLYARKLMVTSLMKRGQTQRAIEMLQPGLTQAPEDAGLMRLAGELYLNNNELAKAAQYFERATKAEPKNVQARTKLGLSLLGVGDTQRALAELDAAVQLDPEQYQADVALVMSYLLLRDHERALQAVASLEAKQPNNPLTYNLKAAIFLDKNDQAAGRKALERALELRPTYIAAAKNLAELDLADKNPQAARQRFEAILKKDNDNVQALLALAEMSPRIGATRSEQIEWLERARKANPAALRPQLMLARVYVGAGETKKALEVAQQAYQGNSNNTEVLDMLGSIQLAAGEKNQALTTYNRLIEIQPNASPLVLYRFARAQAANGNRAGAASALRRALALKPDLIEAQAALVELELVAGRLTEAMKVAHQVQKQAAKSALGFVLEGDVLTAQKKFPQAVKAYETAYGMDNSGATAVKLHTAYIQAGQWREAETLQAQWLKASPDDMGVRIYIADANLKSGRYQTAISLYETLLKSQPNNVALLNNLAFAYQQVKDPRALATAERAYKVDPNNVVVIDTLGWLLVEQGNAKRGLELLEKAVTAAPKAYEIRYHFAQALVKSGDRSRAHQELEKLLADAPSSPYAKEAKQLLSDLGR